MKNQGHKSKQSNGEFNYAEFEKQAIAKLRQGHELVGSEGVLQELIQRIVSAALEGEITHHLKEEKEQGIKGNRKNGSTSKQLKTSLGEVPINPPRDRTGTFDPLLIKKWDRNLNTGLDSQILELYTIGNSVLDIQKFVEKMYGVQLSTGQISTITDQVWEEVVKWQSRALSPFYALIYLDAIHFNIREDGQVKNKAIYTVYGVNASGERDILALHVGQAEGAKEWGRLLEKLKARGIEDVLFFAVDGLTGFKEAILEVFPKSIIQRCIVHMVRTSLKFVAEKDYKEICVDLRKIYTSDDEQAGLSALESFANKWDKKYPEISKKWRENWFELTAFFSFNSAVRRMIYTTNAVEGLHRMMRRITKTKGAFTNDKALLKILFLNLMRNRKTWSQKVFYWAEVQRGLIREFGERFTKHIDKDAILIE
jgi:putative transposase